MTGSIRMLLVGAAWMMANAAMPAAPAAEPAQALVDAAVLKAKAQNKTVFIHTTASW